MTEHLPPHGVKWLGRALRSTAGRHDRPGSRLGPLALAGWIGAMAPISAKAQEVVEIDDEIACPSCLVEAGPPVTLVLPEDSLWFVSLPGVSVARDSEGNYVAAPVQGDALIAVFGPDGRYRSSEQPQSSSCGPTGRSFKALEPPRSPGKRARISARGARQYGGYRHRPGWRRTALDRNCAISALVLAPFRSTSGSLAWRGADPVERGPESVSSHHRRSTRSGGRDGDRTPRLRGARQIRPHEEQRSGGVLAAGRLVGQIGVRGDATGPSAPVSHNASRLVGLRTTIT